MGAKLKEAKRTIRKFMQGHYSDERLAALLAHAQDGKLAFTSCCCFIGIITADHALQDGSHTAIFGHHYARAHGLPDADEAETAFLRLGEIAEEWGDSGREDALARRRIIPIIKAEQRRRERLRAGGVPESIQAQPIRVQTAVSVLT